MDVDIVLRPWRDDDLDWWVSSLLQWRPTWSGEDLRQRAASGRYVRRTVAEGSGGARLGSAMVVRPLGAGLHLGLTLHVVPEHRGGGVGAGLWHDVESRAQGLELLSGMPGGDARSSAVARHWGFDVVSVSIDSDLEVSRGVPAPRTPPGIEVHVVTGDQLVEQGPDIGDLLQASQTNPEATELGWRFTRDDFMAMTPMPVWVVLVEGGRPVAVTLADASGGERWDVYFTGVAPEARGRGFGRTVKEHLHAAAVARGARVLGTGNEERNVAVRGLNESMGYVVVGSDLRLRRPGAVYDGRPFD